jgi:hypothetical protein
LKQLRNLKKSSNLFQLKENQPRIGLGLLKYNGMEIKRMAKEKVMAFIGCAVTTEYKMEKHYSNAIPLEFLVINFLAAA